MDLVILDMAKAEHTLCVEQHAVLQNRERDFCVFMIRRFWGKWKNQLAGMIIQSSLNLLNSMIP